MPWSIAIVMPRLLTEFPLTANEKCDWDIIERSVLLAFGERTRPRVQRVAPRGPHWNPTRV